MEGWIIFKSLKIETLKDIQKVKTRIYSNIENINQVKDDFFSKKRMGTFNKIYYLEDCDYKFLIENLNIQYEWMKNLSYKLAKNDCNCIMVQNNKSGECLYIYPKDYDKIENIGFIVY